MRQSISLVTLVADYLRATAFYETLGWSPARESQETAFFQANGVVLVLWAREKLAPDTGVAFFAISTSKRGKSLTTQTSD